MIFTSCEKNTHLTTDTATAQELTNDFKTGPPTPPLPGNIGLKGYFEYVDPDGEFTDTYKFNLSDVELVTQMDEDEGNNTYFYSGQYMVINDTFEVFIQVNNGVVNEIKYVISNISSDHFTLTDIYYPQNVRTYNKIRKLI